MTNPQPQWVCPRCHITLRSPMALCIPCDRPGNGSARFPDGSIQKADRLQSTDVRGGG